MTTTLDWVRATAFEVARGSVIGAGQVDPRLTGRRRLDLCRSVPPRQAFEDAVVVALQRSPCVVMFSGGRDSSAVLAVAVHCARRLGLDEPIALTRYWPAYPDTDEARWQELVVDHLGVKHWERVAFEEMEVVGPTCSPSLARRGPLWPPLLHSWPPLFALARGGAVLTGDGGDELFDPVRCTVLRWVMRRPTDLRKAAVARAVLQSLAPRAIRSRKALAKGEDVEATWLRPDVRAAHLDELARWLAEEPLLWLASVTRAISDRSHRIGDHNMDVLATEYGIEIVRPFLEPAFVAACALQAGPLGFPGRAAAMRSVFGTDLPAELLGRPDKAYTTTLAFGEAAKHFAAGWSGGGLDPRLVDTDVLRSLWLQGSAPVTSILALQAAWYHDHSHRPLEGDATSDDPSERLHDGAVDKAKPTM